MAGTYIHTYVHTHIHTYIHTWLWIHLGVTMQLAEVLNLSSLDLFPYMHGSEVVIFQEIHYIMDHRGAHAVIENQ